MDAPTRSGTELRVNGDALSKLYTDYLAGSFLVNRRYQRKLVWSVEEKAMLIDSILKDLPIPLILLAEYVGPEVTSYEIIDGLQRLNAVFSFIENEFAVDGRYFDLETLGDTKLLRDRDRLSQKTPTMAREDCLRIVNYQLPVSTYRSASYEAIDEVFRRINSAGRKLSLQEIRQAGVTSRLARIVRRISSAIRGDATLTEVLPLAEIPKISITSRSLEYGILDQDIFWIAQGILDKDSVRESRDEELVLDLVLDMVLDPLATTGSEYRNSTYGRGTVGQATSQTNIESRIQLYGEEAIYRDFFLTFEVVKEIIAASATPWAAWTITQRNPRGIPRHFHAVFVSIFELIHKEQLVVADVDQLTRTLRGFWNRDLSIPPGGGVWGANRKRALFDAIKVQLRGAFCAATNSNSQKMAEAASQFETQLQMALTEQSLFELKQGFMTLSASPTFDDGCFEKVLRTASAMANHGPDSSGWIFFGVADDDADAERVREIHGVQPVQVGKFSVTGTAHELAMLGRSVDEMMRWLVDRVKQSRLEPSFGKDLASTLVPFEYHGRLLWSMNPHASDEPVNWDSNFYRRIGNSTEAVTGQDLVGLVRKFALSQS